MGLATSHALPRNVPRCEPSALARASAQTKWRRCHSLRV